MKDGGPEGIGGWLVLLCALLVIWQPLALATALSSVLPSIGVRGLPAIAILAIRLAVAALGVGAGMALLQRRDGALVLTKVSLTATAFTDLFVLYTPYFPSNRVPGDEPLHAAVIIGTFTVWMTYLLRSRRVRNTFHP